MQILCTLQNVKSFLVLFPSDLFPHSITRSGNIITNADPQTVEGSHWLAIQFEPMSYTAHVCGSCGIFPIIPNFHAFLRRNFTVWDYNTLQLQGLFSTVCGQYCCLFALYMDRVYTRNNSWDYSLVILQTDK